jgi:3-isopropylmalate/(R)-2-methylmalate dehydratase large subunit
LAERIIARAAGREAVAAGEVVTCRVDLAMVHDSSGPRRLKPLLERLGVGVWDPDRVVVATDHFVPVFDEATRKIQNLTREWVKAQAIRAYYEAEGICHVVTPERGHLRPGMFAVGGDSHSPTGGAFGAFMFGIGATEMAGVMATGEIWVKVPETLLIRVSAPLSRGVYAKDLMLHLCGRLGMDGGGYRAVQYAGSGVAAMGMQDRMTLSNMAAELGGQTGLIGADGVTRDYLAALGVEAEAGWDVAEGHEVVEVDGATLAPQVAAPHSPANAAAVSEFADVAPNVAYIGACTGAKLADLRAAAEVLKGRKARMRLLVAPASVRDQAAAEADGVMGVLEAAGAEVLPTSCGICAGYGENRLSAEAVCISSTARNFKGRMGDAGAQVYLASPATVAAAAVAGRIVDPREFL